MIWLMLITLVVVFIFGFRVLSASDRRVVQAITKRLNIDPVYVESMMLNMGKQESDTFVRYVHRGGEVHMANAAAVLLIYQTFIIEGTDNNLIFWHNILRKAMLPGSLSVEHIRLALSFFRELAPDSHEMREFRHYYNARFVDAHSANEESDSNVVPINRYLNRH